MAALQRRQCSIATVNRWLKLTKLKPCKPGPKGPSKVNLEILKAEVEASPESYIAELAEKLNVSCTTICNHLKRLKLTRKKNHSVRRAK